MNFPILGYNYNFLILQFWDLWNPQNSNISLLESLNFTITIFESLNFGILEFPMIP